MNPDDLEIEEYRSLRNSIDMHMKLIPEIFTIMIAATSVLLGYGFKYQSFLVFLLPVFIILTFSFLIIAQMNEIMFKGAYIKKRFEENIFGWESTLFSYRKIRGKKKGLLAKAAEDALAFVLIIDILIVICLLGFLLFFNLKVIQLIFSENPDWLLCVFLVLLAFVWICVAGCAYILNGKMLKAYTFENEQKILENLDKVFKNNEALYPRRE
jgi:hypothetical protein